MEVECKANCLQAIEDEESIVSKLSIDAKESLATTTVSTAPGATVAASSTATNADVKVEKAPHHRSRYVWKTRTRRIQHEPPASMKQYNFKPWKEVPGQLSGIEVVDKDEEREENAEEDGEDEEEKEERKPVEDMAKIGLLRSFEYEHPIVTLNVGTLKANIRRALAESSIPVPDGSADTSAGGSAMIQSSLTPEVVVSHLNKAVKAAATVKRRLQRLVGGFVQLIFSGGIIEASDRDILDHLCPRSITEPDAEVSSGKKSSGNKKKKKKMKRAGYDHGAFVGMLARYLHSGNPPGSTTIGRDVQQFITRAEDLRLLPKHDRHAAWNVMEFPASTITRSITSDLVAQFSRLYKDGSKVLHGKVNNYILKQRLDNVTGEIF